jgi:bleomycin hydrolase
MFVDQTNAQEKKKIGGYEFTAVKDLKATPVKDQYRSGTCWSFSGISFMESELIRKGKGEFDLSEMFIVRNAYEKKAEQYIRWSGKKNFGAGGAFHDMLNVLKNNGIVPQEAYPGLLAGDSKVIHSEMDGVLKAIVDELIRIPNGKLSPVWQKVISDVLSNYLGAYPSAFTYNGRQYTPQSFSRELGINPDDYVEITSFTHHPFYTKFVLEIPDNWAMESIYNVPINEFAEIIESSIMNGYTVAWGADVSDDGFSFKKGVAMVPEKDWIDIEKKEKDSIFNKPLLQKKITQEERQLAFDNHRTTDDHGMHITGISTDQLGQRYYRVKNSWGTRGSDYEGYFYASEAYVLLSTTSIMVNKNAIPADIAKKLNVK